MTPRFTIHETEQMTGPFTKMGNTEDNAIFRKEQKFNLGHVKFEDYMKHTVREV